MGNLVDSTDPSPGRPFGAEERSPSLGDVKTQPDLRSETELAFVRLVDRLGIPSQMVERLQTGRPTGSRFGPRYEEQEVLGQGGMGTVIKAHDRQLDRTVALKVVRPDLVHKRLWRVLVEEGRATRNLQHPCIAEVQDSGITGDGAPFLVTRYYPGETLAAAITRVHEGGHPNLGIVDLVRLMLPLAEAVAYGHARGVIHRDIKAANLMLVDEGRSVVLIDWGMARIVDDALRREHVRGGSLQSMPPEQARGCDEPDARVDVYSLGAVLYAILEGRGPWEGTPEEILAHLRTGPRPPTPRELRPPGLRALVAHAMEPEVEERLGSAEAFAAALRRWLERRSAWVEANQRLGRAAATARNVDALRAQAQDRARAAAALRRALPAIPADEDLAPVFAAEDRVRGLHLRCEEEEQRAEVELRAALALAPDLGEAERLLGKRLVARHQAAVRRGDDRDAARLGVRLAELAVPRVRRYLAGRGRLCLRFSDPTVHLQVFPLVSHLRRRVRGAPAFEGRGARLELDLPEGSYEVQVTSEAGVRFTLPVLVERLGLWEHRCTSAGPAVPVWVPGPGDLGPDECYVPGGRLVLGGDPLGAGAPLAEPLTVHLQPYVVQRIPVDNARYCAFLNELIATGRGDLAARCEPRIRGGTGAPSRGMYERDAEGYRVGRDPSGDLWSPDWAVCVVDQASALAFLRHERTRTGLPWRLPTEAEWALAAGGVDGRPFPWGDEYVPGWAHTRDSATSGRRGPTACGTHPLDTSPYGVQDTAGNMAEMTASPSTDTPDPVALSRPGGDPPTTGHVVVRGGSWAAGAANARLSTRGALSVGRSSSQVGFRLVRSIGPGLAR